MVTLVCVDGMALITIANPAAAATWPVVEIQVKYVVDAQPLKFTISISEYHKDTAMLEYAWYPFVASGRWKEDITRNTKTLLRSQASEKIVQ